MRERLIELLDARQDRGQKWSHYENGQSVESLSNSTLADYLLANGVIVLPCEEGDTFYGVNETSYDTYCVYDFKWGKRNGDGDYVLTLITVYDMEFIWGEEAFPTKEEAENALKKMKGGAE